MRKREESGKASFEITWVGTPSDTAGKRWSFWGCDFDSAGEALEMLFRALDRLVERLAWGLGCTGLQAGQV